MKNQKLCFNKLYGYVGMGIIFLLGVVFLMTSVMGIKTSTNSRASATACKGVGLSCGSPRYPSFSFFKPKKYIYYGICCPGFVCKDNICRY